MCTGPPRSPDNVNVTVVHQKTITFNWSFIPDCTSVTYNISSNCGSCPEASSNTSVTCSDWQQSMDESGCTFSVQSSVCGCVGTFSTPVTVTSKGRPRIISIYSVLCRYYI